MGEADYEVQTYAVVAVAAPTIVLQPNPDRVYVGFGQLNSADVVKITPHGWPGGDAPITIPTAGLTEFYYSRHGCMVAGAWMAQSGGAASTLSIWELRRVKKG